MNISQFIYVIQPGPTDSSLIYEQMQTAASCVREAHHKPTNAEEKDATQNNAPCTGGHRAGGVGGEGQGGRIRTHSVLVSLGAESDSVVRCAGWAG